VPCGAVEFHESSLSPLLGTLSIMNFRRLLVLGSVLYFPCAHAHEGRGHAGGKAPEKSSIETEFYLGKHGYYHGGVGLVAPLGGDFTLGISGHVVMEHTGATEVPSLEVELVRELSSGLEVEGFGFIYPKVEGKSALGGGLRATRSFSFGEVKVAPFFGPTYAHVEAEREETGELAGVGHLMLLGGVSLEAGPLTVTLLGTHSFYDDDPAGLETPVDLESMTHFTAYENNDGLARTTAAVELSYAFTECIALQLRYASMWFDDETRHAVALMPSFQIHPQVQLTAGVQLLRGGEAPNDLVFAGLMVTF